MKLTNLEYTIFAERTMNWLLHLSTGKIKLDILMKYKIN